MDLTEAMVYEALDLPVPEAGEQVQDSAAPADQPSQSAQDEGAQAQDPAAPAAGADENGRDTDPRNPGADSAEDDAEDGSGAENEPLTLQQRRENAARRRQQERQTAIDQAVQAALEAEREKQNKQMEVFFSRAGLKNPNTGEPITNFEQFDDWYKQHSLAQLQRDLKAGNLTVEGLQQAMDTHPVIQQLLQQQAAAAAAPQQIPQQPQLSAAEQALVDADLAKISAWDPSIKSVNDLMVMPGADTFREYVKRGYSFADAFYHTHKERIDQQMIEAAKQQALNNARSKDHLNSVTNSRANGMKEVPAAELAMFRAINPHATDAEIQAYYNKNCKH